MPKRGGSGRRLTYRERWEQLRDWVADPAGFVLYAKARRYVAPASEDAFASAHMAIVTKIEDLDHRTLVKARPVQRRKGRKR